MAVTSHRRLVNPQLGTYFGIFVSVMAALVLMVLIFERLGVSPGVLEPAMLLGPRVVYGLIGAGTFTRDPAEFFTAGRRVPAVYTGLVLANSAVGATGMVVVTGLFFIDGFDAWCLAIGIWSGFVATALLIAPYIRKFGAYTVPSYLGRRFESRLVRMVSAGGMMVPMLLVAAAELKIGAFAAGWLSGGSQAAMTFVLVAAVLATLLFGGMRSLSWTGAAQAIAALLALIVPVAMAAAYDTNLPLPQLSHGPVLRGIGRLEAQQGIPTLLAPLFAVDFASTELSSISHRIAQPYASVGPIAFILMIVTVMCGVASAPWLLPRYGCTTGVYEARKATAWAIVFAGLTLVTSASIAVFMRDNVMQDLTGRATTLLPEWFERLRALGHVGFEPTTGPLALSSFGFARDATVFALPISQGFPNVVLYMALAGVIAAALAAASGAIIGIAAILTEDGFSGLIWEAPQGELRLVIARIAIGGVAILAGWVAIFMPADPLDLLLWAFALSGSAAFPVLMLSIWWKRLNALGALAGMVAGFVVALLAITAGEAAWLGIPGSLASVFGLPAGFAAAIIATRFAPPPGRHVLALVRDMRLPGGETIYDREVRLQRLKQQRGP